MCIFYRHLFWVIVEIVIIKGEGSHEEGASQLVCCSFLLVEGYLGTTWDYLAESVAQQSHHTFLSEFLVQQFLELVHLEESIPVSKVDFNFIKFLQLFLHFSHEIDDQQMKGFNSESHNMVEGEFNESIINIFLQLIDMIDFFHISFFFVLLLVNFIVNLMFDLVDIIFVLSTHTPIIVKNFQ